MTAAPAALVLAHAPSARPLPGLAERLDPARRAGLQALLVRRAAEWAAAAAPGAAFVAAEPADAVVELAALVPDSVTVFAAAAAEPADAVAERTAASAGLTDPAAVGAAIEHVGRGPLLIVRTDCVRLGPGHAAAALADLAAGCDVVVGPELDGGWYIAALAEPRPELLAVPAVGVATGGLGPLLARARELGAEVGMLRHERRLVTPADADALLADPLLPADLRAALASAA